jgi:putative zinc finger/helix-turn-helix YgiT family protein
MDDKDTVMQPECFRCGSKKTKVMYEDYQYIESGLDNVILKDIPIVICKNCKSKMPIIPMIESLHKTIGFALIKKTRNLSGKEIRFLRKLMGLTSLQLAIKLEVSEVTLSRWENDKESIGKPNDKLLRLLFISSTLSKTKGYKHSINDILNLKHIDDHTDQSPILIPMSSFSAQTVCLENSIC